MKSRLEISVFIAQRLENASVDIHALKQAEEDLRNLHGGLITSSCDLPPHECRRIWSRNIESWMQDQEEKDHRQIHTGMGHSYELRNLDVDIT